MVDRIWWDWQNRDSRNFYSYNGGSVQKQNSFEESQTYPTGVAPFLNVSSQSIDVIDVIGIVLIFDYCSFLALFQVMACGMKISEYGMLSILRAAYYATPMNIKLKCRMLYTKWFLVRICKIKRNDKRAMCRARSKTPNKKKIITLHPLLAFLPRHHFLHPWALGKPQRQRFSLSTPSPRLCH